MTDKTLKTNFTVHDLPVSERPRERLRRLGVAALSTQEILAVLLGRGTAGQSVIDISNELVKRFGSIKGIAGASLEELSQIKGIGLAKGAQIKAAFELANRLEKSPEIGEAISCRNPEDIAAIMKSLIRGKKKEHFWTLLLDTRNRLLRIAEISVGSLDTSIVHPREVFIEAIAASAASVIFVHNHPSGDCTPSADDIELTKRLVKAGEIIGVDVLDHLIVSDKGYLSLKSKGLF